jgi:hypothetical protein
VVQVHPPPPPGPFGPGLDSGRAEKDRTFRDFAFEPTVRRWAAGTADRGGAQAHVQRTLSPLLPRKSKNRIYEPVPFDLLTQFLSEREIVREVSAGLSETAAHLDAGRLFTMVGLLSTQLSKPQAANVLDFVFDQFEPLLRDSDGDGSWREELAPGNDVPAALAGYLWGALAAPEGAVRWEGAHTIRALARASDHEILAPLIANARAKRPEAADFATGGTALTAVIRDIVAMFGVSVGTRNFRKQ